MKHQRLFRSVPVSCSKLCMKNWLRVAMSFQLISGRVDHVRSVV